MINRYATFFTFCVLGVFATVAEADAPRYTIKAIPNTIGGMSSKAFGLNSHGRVVGGADITPGGNLHAFAWDNETGMIELGTPGSDLSCASDVNDLGWVVGMAKVGSSDRGFVWSSTCGMIELDTLGGSRSDASAINNNGHTVGYADKPGTNERGCRWEIADPCAPPSPVENPDDTAIAHGINNFAVVVAGKIHGYGFVWLPDDGTQDLPTFGGSRSNGYGISDGGIIVGFAHTASEERHAARWESLPDPPQDLARVYRVLGSDGTS